MAVSKYFNHISNKSEQDLFESLTVETIQLSGLDIKYMPRVHGIDDILREQYQSEFREAITVEAYFHDVQGFGGQGDIMSKFGFQQMDTLNVSIAKKRWRDLKVPDRLERPREGDLIYIPFSKSMFEINFVEHEDPFWQLGRYNVFKLSCAMYTRGYNEKFSTTDVDVNNAGFANNPAEIDAAINEAIETKTGVLVDFTEKNPFGNF